MALSIARTEDEVDEVLNACIDSEDTGATRWPGMSYEQGVRAGIEWLVGQHNDNPMED